VFGESVLLSAAQNKTKTPQHAGVLSSFLTEKLLKTILFDENYSKTFYGD
jgi:hypothetical protein